MTTATRLTALPPSGEQWTLRSGDWEATVVGTGGGIRRLVRAGREVLAGYAEDGPVVGARGQLLLPWPNRIRDGAYDFDGQHRQVPLTEAARHNAIHGLTRWCSWHALERDADRVVLGYRLPGQPGYPWTLDLRADYQLSADGLSVTLSAGNRSTSAAPFAAGMHPYLAPRGGVDTARLTLPAATRQLVDARLLPTRTEPVAGDYDFRGGRPVGAVVLDDAFTDLDRDADGTARCRLDDLELWLGPGWRWVQVFTADTLDGRDRRASVAIEPMTSPPDAFNSGRDLVVLAPGETWTGRFGLTLAR
ncbi:MAG: aldose 1-epimerase family protein [Marmoricola sp.]